MLKIIYRIDVDGDVFIEFHNSSNWLGNYDPLTKFLYHWNKNTNSMIEYLKLNNFEIKKQPIF